MTVIDEAPEPTPDVYGLFAEALARLIVIYVNTLCDFLASTPPFSWLDAALRGSVGPES